MSTIRRMNTYTIDHEGRTCGLSESGPLELSTALSPWIRLVSSWVDQGRDVEEAADEMDGAHARQARRIRDAMISVGVLRQLETPGAVRFVGASAELARAVERGSLPLPDVVLGAGPLHGDWFGDVLTAAGAGRAGVVLFTEGAAVVAGPMDARRLEDVVTALRCGGLADGRPGPAAVRTAAAQLVRRAALGTGGDDWSGLTVTREGTTNWRALPHPWRPAPPGPAAGPFDERVMAAVDPVHGVVREIAEDDLPQVPRHLARARVVGRASIRPLDLDVVADGPDYEQARRRTMLAALALYLESGLDPRAVVDAAGEPVLTVTTDTTATLDTTATTDPTGTTDGTDGLAGDATEAPGTTDAPGTDGAIGLAALRAATDRIAADPGRHFLPARRVSDDGPALVPVARARRCDGGAGPAPGTAAAETREDALTAALLDVLESWAAGATAPVARVLDGDGLPADVRDALDRLRLVDRGAWLGVVTGSTVPTAVATTPHGTAHACGISHAAAAVRAMEQAVLADQVLMHGRPDLVPRTWTPALPPPDRTTGLPGTAPIGLAGLRRAVAERAPDAVVADLDHDPGIVRLGISAVKVVADR